MREAALRSKRERIQEWLKEGHHYQQSRDHNQLSTTINVTTVETDPLELNLVSTCSKNDQTESQAVPANVPIEVVVDTPLPTVRVTNTCSSSEDDQYELAHMDNYVLVDVVVDTHLSHKNESHSRI